jgi:hypothetical protein
LRLGRAAALRFQSRSRLAAAEESSVAGDWQLHAALVGGEGEVFVVVAC